jgi:hypothetical protein
VNAMPCARSQAVAGVSLTCLSFLAIAPPRGSGVG